VNEGLLSLEAENQEENLSVWFLLIGIVHLTDRLRLQMALNGSTVDIPGQGWVAISTTGLTQNHPQLTAQLRV
jgi:hypothetical protein